MGTEAAVRLGAYAAVFAAVALLEIRFPRRPRRDSKAARWTTNLSITFLDTLVVRLLFPMTAVTVAAAREQTGGGLLGAIDLPPLLEGVAAVVLFDLLIYAQHAAFHLAPPLWRLHMMHHTDLDIDLTTGARFHPIEIALSMLIKMAAAYLLAPPAWAVVAFEVILNGMATFNHGNVALPFALDRLLRLAVVTPDMHRVHHSVIIKETNSNYGFNLSVWDRLFGTYRDQPLRGHLGMTIGLANFRDGRDLRLARLLAMPFGDKTR